MNRDLFKSPLESRYASKEMLSLFSDQFKYITWRRLWLALAKGEKALGLPIINDQIKEIEKNLEKINFENVEKHEKKLKHDVMAHLHAFAEQCPKAGSILHLGATSAYVTDNADIIQVKEALKLVEKKLIDFIKLLKAFALKNKDLACLSYTHFQPAQPTTLGKRACLWLQDFILDLEDLRYRLNNLSFLGLKGASGTQSSFLNLLEGDSLKVKKLEKSIGKEMGFSKIIPISGQTYTRKQDVQFINVLAGIAISAHKCATDLRLLAHLREVAEPFGKEQVGSSAMPHKQNPILAERICALSRFVIALSENPSYTAATQWLERTLDDSANRRLVIPEAFLTIDAVLELGIELFSKIQVYPKIIEKHLKDELPFLLTEEILMEASKRGKDRQKLHERLRKHSQDAFHAINVEGKPNNLLDLIRKDPMFKEIKEEVVTLAQITHFSGRASEQVEEFTQSIEGLLC